MAKIEERRVALSYREVALSLVSLERLLALRGIDVTQPYTQEDHPRMHCHLYRQRRRVEDDPRDRQ